MSIFNFNLKVPKSQSSGFILLEIMAALIVLISISIVLGSWYSNAVATRVHLHKRAEALILASRCIEQFRGQGAIKLKDLPDYFKLSWQLVPDDTVSHFSRLTVSVSWQEKNRTSIVELATGVLT